MAETVKPLVSIILPVYNGENYLKESIESALAQTYDNIEVIVVNDGSTDKTEAIAQLYGSNIRYFAKENGGVSTALNLGLSQMRGDYFSWLSHDDLYQADKIQIEMDALKNDLTQIVYSDYSIIDSNGAIITAMNIAEKYPDLDWTLGLFPILRQVLNGCSLLIHKSHFERVGVFDEQLRVTQDYDLWFKMFRGQKLIYINRPLVMLREHGSQVTHNYERNRIESDDLWLKMISNITEAEMIALDGAETEFWNKQAEFLWCTPYKNARRYAEARRNILGCMNVSIRVLSRRCLYQVLSGISRGLRFLGIQKNVKKSKLFHWGYKMWIGVRYK